MATAIGHSYMEKVGTLATEKLGAPYTWRNGLVFFKNWVVVSPNSCHSGILWMFKRLSPVILLDVYYQVVQYYVSSCDVCQRNKAETLSPTGLLHVLPILCHVWEDITMDFIKGLPSSNGKNTILLVVDRLSKSAHFLALAHPFTQNQWLRNLWRGWLSFTVCLGPSSVVVNLFFLETFCMNFSNYQERSWKWAPPTLHRWTTNQKEPTDAWNNIFNASSTTNCEKGVLFFLGLNSDTTRLITHPQRWRIAKCCMVAYPQPFCITKWAHLQSKKWTNISLHVMCCWANWRKTCMQLVTEWNR